ncbi:MAG: phosphotransferase [Myxococcota bacterium]
MARGSSGRGSAADPAAAEGLRRAVEAWREIGAADHPIDAELLTGGRHATTVHLRPSGGSGASVVAKVRPPGGLDLERLIHEVILPDLGVETPEFLGFASGSAGESDVLFLEYVGSAEFQSSDPAHQEAAGRWLGRFHAASARASMPALIPRRDLEEDRVEVSSARMQLASILDNPALGDEGGLLVSRVLELLDTATGRWSEWAERTAWVPRVLTHGAFISRNVRMRGAGSTLTTLPFDWDHVAIRSPAIDLARTSGPSHGFGACASLGRYRTTLAAHGLPLDRSVVAAVAAMGTVIRAAACIGWLIGSLESEYANRRLGDVEIYRQALEGALSE